MHKKDIVSNVLKIVLVLTFLFVDMLMLFGGNVLTVEFMLPNYVLFFAAVIFLFIIVKGWKGRKTLVMSQKKENALLVGVMILLFCVQAVVVYEIIFRTSWDVAAVWYGSNWVAQGDVAGIEEMSEYYSIYPNNLLLVYIFSRILKLNMLFGSPISNGGLLLALVQCLVIDVAGMLVFKCAKHFVGLQSAIWILILYMILIGLSPWIVLPYSDGMGIIYPVLLLYLYLRCKETSLQWKKYLYVLILFAVGVVAYHIKPYAVIVLIAEVLIEAADLVRNCWNEKKLDHGVRRVAVTVILAMAGMAGASFLVSQMSYSMGFSINEEREMGISHYLMMGANVKTWGGYSYEDMEYGSDLSQELRTQAELQEFKQRLQKMGIKGYAELFVHKAAKNYLDGTYGWNGEESFYTEIYPPRGSVSDILRSWYYGFGDLYPYHALLRQLMWIMVLVPIPFASLLRNAFSSAEKVLVLSVLGLMLYLQIFEAHARYVFTFVPLYLVLALLGVKNIRQMFANLVFLKQYIHTREENGYEKRS